MSLSVRLPGDLYNALSELSEREERTLAGQIVYMLRREMERYVRGEDKSD